MTTFIGIDLAWQGDTNHSGGAVLVRNEDDLRLRAISHGLARLDDVLGFIDRYSTADTVVAIDAPLVLENLDGQRPCELLISQKFGAKHASAHSSNLTKYARPTSVRLARELEARHFLHCPLPDTQRRAGRWFFEVYPHPAHVVLFQRKYIVKYKKGRIADRRTGLEEMRREVRTHCTIAEPRLAVTPTLAAFLQKDLGALKGARLKEYEDTLDAILCAYLAAHNWRWAAERNEMIGDIRTGYIVNPTVAAQPGVAPDGASRRR